MPPHVMPLASSSQMKRLRHLSTLTSARGSDRNCWHAEIMKNLAEITVASQAEALAGVMEDGGLQDRGGPDALRLLAAVVQATAPAQAAGWA